MKKENAFIEVISWAVVMFVIALLLSLTSCGSRKVSTSKTKEETKTETVKSETSKTETDIKTETTVKENISFDVVAESENLVPVDPLKPITKTETISGNTKTTVYDNATVNRNQTTDKSDKTSEIKRNEAETVKSDVIKVKETKSESLKVEKDKETERSEPIIWCILILGGVIIFFIWIGRRKK